MNLDFSTFFLTASPHLCWLFRAEWYFHVNVLNRGEDYCHYLTTETKMPCFFLKTSVDVLRVQSCRTMLLLYQNNPV